MDRLQIPYEDVLHDPLDFDHDEFDSLLRHYIENNDNQYIIIEIFNEYVQYLLFIRERMLYWAAVNGGDGFKGITIRELFIALKSIQFPQIVSYGCNLLLFHSLLVYLQKKASLKVNSSLVDLDEILDKFESENKSTLVTAYQPYNFLMLRYKCGQPVACLSENIKEYENKTSLREEFLVKIYTLSSHRPFEIKTFEDLTVTHAKDSKNISSNYHGTVSSLFLSLPPKLVIKLKKRPLKTYPFTGKMMTIGRNRENDIVIDNLSVSRKHAAIESKGSAYIIKDMESKNGTFLNGNMIVESKLKNGDVITVGKYQIVFKIPCTGEQQIDDLEQTVIIPGFHNGNKGSDINIHYPLSPKGIPKLFRRSIHREYTLDRKKIIVGKSKDADIKIGGLLTPKRMAEITKEDNEYILKRLSGRKKLKINGEEMSEKVLEEEDLIAIGKEEFVFKY